ncbi:MAG: hypothetical protein KDI22_09485, partial [Gammaproteobacteria bacterium]|nr:hypothetical protein [Gammaproteobacteria bacterium]
SKNAIRSSRVAEQLGEVCAACLRATSAPGFPPLLKIHLPKRIPAMALHGHAARRSFGEIYQIISQMHHFLRKWTGNA